MKKLFLKTNTITENDIMDAIGYFIPIKKSSYFKMFYKKGLQLQHCEYFEQEIKEIICQFNNISIENINNMNYKCIPRFSFLASRMTLYIPHNYHLNEMAQSYILSKIGCNKYLSSIKIEPTVIEDLEETSSLLPIHDGMIII